MSWDDKITTQASLGQRIPLQNRVPEDPWDCHSSQLAAAAAPPQLERQVSQGGFVNIGRFPFLAGEDRSGRPCFTFQLFYFYHFHRFCPMRQIYKTCTAEILNKEMDTEVKRGQREGWWREGGRGRIFFTNRACSFAPTFSGEDPLLISLVSCLRFTRCTFPFYCVSQISVKLILYNISCG